MELIITFIVFLAVTVIVISGSIIIKEKRSEVATRLKRYVNQTQYETSEISKAAREKISHTSPFASIGRLFVSGTLAKKVELQLMRAEIPMRGEEFLVIIFMAMFVAGFAGFAIFGGIGPASVLFFLTAGSAFFLINARKQKRFYKLNNQIGESLTVMTNALRAGYSFQQSMDLASKEMNGPLSVEYRRTVREINLGTTIEEALLNLNNRVNSDDLELVITAVLIQRQIGGNLAEIFDNISFTIRERIRIKGEIKTLTAQGRISGLIIGFLPVALFCILMLINPDYMSVLITNPIGRLIIAGGLFSEFIGLMFIKKIISIDV